jgi:ribonuclease inhibitor
MKRERRLALNAMQMTTRERAHAHIKERFNLPDWYGNNLDALNDCLGEIGEPTHIIVRNTPVLEQSLGDYGGKLVRVLEQATEENENLRLTLRSWF